MAGRRAIGISLLLLLLTSPARGQVREVALRLNVPARELEVLVGGRQEMTFPVAVGRPGRPTPRGSFRVVGKLLDPWWLPPDGGEPVPPGPANPLGRWWIGLNLAGYGLHGTNDESSIGEWVSRGCVRLRNRHAERLFGLVTPGTRVTITYHTAVVRAAGRLLAWGETGLAVLDDRLADGAPTCIWLYPDRYELAPLSRESLSLLLEAAGVASVLSAEEVDWLAARAAAGTVTFDLGAVVTLNAWEIGRGCLKTPEGVFLPWEDVAPVLGLACDLPPGDAVELAGRHWLPIDRLLEECGVPLDFRLEEGRASLEGVAVLVQDRLITGAAFVLEGAAYVLAGELERALGGTSAEGGRVFVAVRPQAQRLGLAVTWDHDRRAVVLTTP